MNRMDNNIQDESVQLKADSPFVLRLDNSKDVPESDIRTALESGNSGFLHSFTTGSAVDGPGIRVVAWTSGCQFKCIYCHNPDTWKIRNGIPVTLEKAAAELEKYSSGLKIMSGGFTLSGGEPLMQDRFAVKLFTAVKKMGIHTALDTNGSLGNRLDDSDLEKIDLVLLDIKAWDQENHRRITGHDNVPVIEFAERLALIKKPVWIRFVMVPGYTDNPDEVKMIAKFASRLGNVERIDVLPFHQMGRFKWKELNLNYILEGLEPPSREDVQNVCTYFRAEGLKTY
jgi:pyruvate formate lyase activating enzyme